MSFDPKSIAKFIINSLLHLVMIFVLGLLFYPIASWYFSARPLLGVDFYNTVSQVTILKQNPVLPASAWLPSWFGGWPFVAQYPVLHFYAILPFTFFMSVVDATLLWMIVSTAMYFLGIYILVSEISGNKLLGLITGVGAVYSIGVYGALLWGGSLPFHATVAFFPWGLWMVLCFVRSGNFRFLLFAALTSGISMWGHPQVTVTYLFPGICLLLAFSGSENYPLFRIKQKILCIFMFIGISILIGLPIIYQTFGQSLSRIVAVGGREQALSTVTIGKDVKDLEDFHRSQPLKIYYDTHKSIFIALGVGAVAGLIGFILRPRKRFFVGILPFVLIAVYFTVYIWIFAFDISIYHGGWYRLFWSVPVWLGAMAGAFWKEFVTGISSSFFKKISAILLPIVSIGAAVLIIGLSGMLKPEIVVNNSKEWYQMIVDKYGTQKLKDKLAIQISKLLPGFYIENFILKISDEGKAAISSAYPVEINVYPEDLKFHSSLLPDFLKTATASRYRLYSGDATFNISWSSYSDVPLARGYLDPPITDVQRGYLFWLDAAVNVD
ncbi:MAG: hypothetical protein AAB874_04895, partial [Patescibacteria group bacterium]